MTTDAIDFGAARERAEREAAMTAGFIWQQEPDPDFVRQLRVLSPESEHTSYLLPWWEPGERWVPGQRWMLYELVPPKLIGGKANPRVEELEGPNPRSAGHYCSDYVEDQFQCLCEWKTESWRGGPANFITLTEWQIYKRTGMVPFPFWCVQGTRGGHKVFFSNQEQALLKMLDLPDEPPAVGVLPFAPLDGRVLKAIEGLNRIIQFGNNIDQYRKAQVGEDWEKQVAEAERALRELTVKHVEEQMLDVAELFCQAADAGEMDNQPRTTVDYDALWDPAKASYVETGQLLHPSAVE